ncbi:tRNA pseudouridine(55) synthase TruB [Streptococcus respiraculi]|uniref:tRNA pseudouridine(55) synthase TruB n=1 Tax=Streptococcus respiraculi TaxID=2021971 RepID=UPI000E7503E0|nr:tRNA pseudouridine(55) synthase TruB [Streptococcus respiraculi]
MLSGIINVKKEAGMTSHDVVFKLRKILREKKIGHGGTLDPDVTGVLPIAVGKATRLIEYMQEEGKVYEGEITLGFSTTTEDASGEVVERTAIPMTLTEEEIDQAMQGFVGTITQIPPMYSAVKVNGRKLYEYARAGETVERPERQVDIYQFDRISPLLFENDCVRFSFRVRCSKGTYVRTLSVDLGTQLGFASHMSHLVRTGSSGMVIADALTIEEIAHLVEMDDVTFLQPIEQGIGDVPTVLLTEEEVTDVKHGRFVVLDRSENVLAAFFEGQLVAMLEKREGSYKPRKVFI